MAPRKNEIVEESYQWRSSIYADRQVKIKWEIKIL